HGPADAEGVLVMDQLPDGLTLAEVPPGCTFAGTTVFCRIGHLAAGASVGIDVVVRVEGAGTITNISTVTADTPDPDPGNNQSDASVIGSGTLPATGSETSALLGMAGGFLVAGWMLIVVAFRRRRLM